MKIVRISEVCDVIAGQSPIGTTCNTNAEGIEFHQGKKLFYGDKLLVSDTFTSSPTKLAMAGDILMSVRAPVGPTVYLDRGICIGRGLAAIRAKDEDEVDIRYLYLFLKHIEKTIEGTDGAVFPSINKSQIESLMLPLPNIEEQRRIVAKLDAAFEKIDLSIKLTQKNIKHTQILFENILTNTFDSLPTPKIEQLGCVYDVRDGTHDSPKYHKEGYPLVTSKNLKSGILSMENIQYISQSDYLKINERSKVDAGDVLMAMIGTIGNPIIIESDPVFAIKNVALFKPLDNHNGKFLKYYLQSGSVVKRMDSDAKGATQRFVSLGYLRSFDFPVVSPERESLTIKKLDNIAIATQSLIIKYNDKLTALSKLKQSMLSRAFLESEVK